MVRYLLLLIALFTLIAGCGVSEDVDSTIIEHDDSQSATKQTESPSKGPVCGDAICDPLENSCLCPSDCGRCEKNLNSTHEQVCEQDECIIKEMTATCGDGVCHPDEQGSCALDCPNCADKDQCTRDFFDPSSRSCKHEDIVPCCGNGQCEVGESATCIDDCESEFDLSDYPAPFVVEKQLNTHIVIGEQAGSKGVIAGINIIRGLDFSGAKPGYSTQAILDSEISSIDDKNVILVGNPCHNTHVAALYKINDGDCKQGLSVGDKIIRLFKTGTGTYALVVNGYSEDDVRDASVLIEKWEEMSMTGTEYKQ